MQADYIKQGDCMELMCEIPDHSIDMILCDLPYGATHNQWDIKLPFSDLWEQYKRVIKDNGAIVLFGQGVFTAEMIISNADWFKYTLVWKKGERVSGFLNAKRMPLRNHEDIVVFYKRPPTYNPQFEEGKPLHGRGTKYKTKELVNNNYGYFAPTEEHKGETKKYPKSVLNFEKPHPAIHPTQKPVKLLEWLIRTYTNENDVVLDNCMGVGSTCVVCVNSDRRYIGFELNDSYYKIADDRIREAKESNGRI